MKLSTFNQNTEYGWVPVRYLEGIEKGSDLGGNKPADLIQKHFNEIEYLLTRVPKATAANIRAEVLEKTGVHL
jgi:hypothetical protein